MLILTFLALLAALASRAPFLAEVLPAATPSAAIALVGATLSLVGMIERSTPRGSVGPVWMRLPRLLGLNLAAGFSFFTTVFAQTLGLSLGPVDPSLTGVPPTTAALWFFIFTVGFLGVGMMSAPALMVPLLRVVTAPVAKLKGPAGFAVAAIVGAGFAIALVVGASSAPVTDLLQRGRAFFDANTQLATFALVAIAVGPQLLGLGGSESPSSPAPSDEPEAAEDEPPPDAD